MSSKTTQPGKGEAEIKPEETNAGAEESLPVEAVESSPSVDELQKLLDEAKAQAAEFKDGWQRAVAEFQNYKKRSEADKSETYQIAVGNIIKRYLPVMDDLERALTSRPHKLAWADGIDLIYKKLQSILEAEGVKRMEVEGQAFDPNFHEAISQEKSEGHESGQIIEVVRNGYMLGDKVIRPAMVRVAK